MLRAVVCLGIATSIYLGVLNVLTVLNSHNYPTLEKNMLGTFPLLFTNFCATALVAYKTWSVHSPLRLDSILVINAGVGYTAAPFGSFSTKATPERRSRACSSCLSSRVSFT